MWKNDVEPDRPQITIWCMCIACRMPKATNTHTECVILIALPLQQWLHECASNLHHMYSASLVMHELKCWGHVIKCIVSLCNFFEDSGVQGCYAMLPGEHILFKVSSSAHAAYITYSC